MKKSELKPAKKKIKDDIESGLISQLKSLAGKFGETSEKLEKAISKGAKKLAKKIADEIHIEVPAKETPVAETAPKVKPVKKIAKPTTLKKVAKPAPVKENGKITPVKKKTVKSQE